MSSVTKIQPILDTFNQKHPIFMDMYKRKKEYYQKLDNKNDEFESKFSIMKEDLDKNINE